MNNHREQHGAEDKNMSPVSPSGLSVSVSLPDNSTLVYSAGSPERADSRAVLLSDSPCQRTASGSPDGAVKVLIDRFRDGSTCEFVRLSVQGKARLQLVIPGSFDHRPAHGTGWMFRSKDPERPHFWIPLEPAHRKLDSFGRIEKEAFLSIESIEFGHDSASALFAIPEGADSVDIVIWKLCPGSALEEELTSMIPQERKRMFLWGSHAPFTGLNDLYYYLIHGAVYKTGAPWAFQPMRRSYCEVVAHALYVTFHSLWLETGKMIYQHLKTQIVMSVIARQDDDGAWRHGSWTDDFEVHFRHHCSGIHILCSYYDETKDKTTGAALKQAVDFMRKQHDVLSEGNWYLHDSLELSEESMRKSPVTYQYSRALGKSPSNMLVLNTHLDALVAFSRYEEVTGQSYMKNEITSGINAAVAVLGLKPAETLYRWLFRAIELIFLSQSKVRTLPLPVRALRKLVNQRIIPLLPKIKKTFPRLVMPNGYIDRNLTLNEFWHPYFLINIMDLLRFQMRFNIQGVEPLIHKAFAFVERVGLEKWLKDERTAYAVAFLAEALYLDCLRRSDRSRAALADTALALEDSGLGIPPSLLGCNAEYIRISDQVPCIWAGSDQLRVINLSVDSDHLEFIVINSTDLPKDTSLHRFHKKLMAFDQDGNPLSEAENVTVANRGWIRLLSPEP
jgi:hypothetical protein